MSHCIRLYSALYSDEHIAFSTRRDSCLDVLSDKAWSAERYSRKIILHEFPEPEKGMRTPSRAQLPTGTLSMTLLDVE